MYTYKYIYILLFLSASCSPKVIINQDEVNNKFSAVEPYAAFGIIEASFFQEDLGEYVGELEIKDNGLSLNCDYDAIKTLAKTKANLMGGNCIVITEHREPDMKSTCHRIKATVLRVENPEQYETKIDWDENRKLKISDFKGSTDKRPFLAATYSGLKYQINRPPFGKYTEITANAYFDCTLSYFKHSDRDSATLAHEQIHFDISEIYARKFIQRMKVEATNYKMALNVHDRIFKEIHAELSLKQDEYDSEVYGDRSLQPKWNEWVKKELESTTDYRAKKVKIRSR